MRKHRIVQKFVFLLYLAAVAYLCFGHFTNIPQVPRRIWGVPIDKVMHFCMFFPFPVLFHWAFTWPVKKWWQAVLLTVCILGTGSLIASGTEMIQGMTTYRTADIMDFMADFKALCLSSVIVLVIELSKTLKHEK